MRVTSTALVSKSVLPCYEEMSYPSERSFTTFCDSRYLDFPYRECVIMIFLLLHSSKSSWLRLIAIKLLSGVSNWSCSLSLCNILLRIRAIRTIDSWPRNWLLSSSNRRGRSRSIASSDFLSSFQGACWGAWFSSEDLSRLVDNENTSGCASRRLLQANGGDKSGTGVAQEGVWKILLCFESCVRLWTVLGKAVNRESSTGEISMRITETACLGSAWLKLVFGT